ncbi:MAG: T9SS type A sorting domain-containing protein, partial [Flavobacteriales bacterium]
DLTIDWEGSAPMYRLIYNVGNGWVNVYPTVSDYTVSEVPIGTHVIYYIRSICDDETNFFSSWASGSYTTLSGGKIAQDNSFEIEVYPNPTDGLVNISFDKIIEQNVNVRLVDAFGKEVYRKQFNVGFETSVIDFDISNYAKGVYFLQLVSDDIVKTERIVLH